MEIIDVEKTYSDGRMDIRTLGLAIFEIIDFRNPDSDKTCSRGNVRIKPVNLSVDEARISKVHELLNRFYLHLGVKNPFLKTEEHNSYSFAHKIGLSIEQEYQLLCMESEGSRLDFIIDYLAKDTPLLEQISRTKERIAMNGHFKKFDTLDL